MKQCRQRQKQKKKQADSLRRRIAFGARSECHLHCEREGKDRRQKQHPKLQKQDLLGQGKQKEEKV